jgi:hypothetical protein
MQVIYDAFAWKKDKGRDPAALLTEPAGTQPRGENTMHSVTQGRICPSAPPLGDLNTRKLVTTLMRSWQAGVDNDAAIVMRDRTATVATVRSEVQRRERLGALVRR